MARQPIPHGKIKIIIKFYIEVKSAWLNGDKIKIDRAIAMKARELGFGRAEAWKAIKAAQRSGEI